MQNALDKYRTKKDGKGGCHDGKGGPYGPDKFPVGPSRVVAKGPKNETLLTAQRFANPGIGGRTAARIERATSVIPKRSAADLSGPNTVGLGKRLGPEDRILLPQAQPAQVDRVRRPQSSGTSPSIGNYRTRELEEMRKSRAIREQSLVKKLGNEVSNRAKTMESLRTSVSKKPIK